MTDYVIDLSMTVIFSHDFGTQPYVCVVHLDHLETFKNHEILQRWFEHMKEEHIKKHPYKISSQVEVEQGRYWLVMVQPPESPCSTRELLAMNLKVHLDHLEIFKKLWEFTSVIFTYQGTS